MKASDIDFYNLGFDFIETKTMFVSDYKEGKWDKGKLVPFGPFEISPGACVLNYGQGIFEGMKALKAKTGENVLFRPYENGMRLNNSADRMLMPNYDVNKFVEAVKQVVKENEEYIPPYDSGGALYIRPILIGNGAILGVAPAEEYKLLIINLLNKKEIMIKDNDLEKIIKTAGTNPVEGITDKGELRFSKTIGQTDDGNMRHRNVYYDPIKEKFKEGDIYMYIYGNKILAKE